MSDTATLEFPAPVGHKTPLTRPQWRALESLCRWVERDEHETTQLFGPRARAAVQALRDAQAARRRHRHGTSRDARAAPTAVLAALAEACTRWRAVQQARPPGFYAPASSTLGPGLLLQMPTLKHWLQQVFPLEAAVSPVAEPGLAARQAREVLMQKCLALSGSADGFHRRRHLLELLSAHGHRQPLLRLVRRSAQDWAPAGWADSWEAVAGIADEEQALTAIDRACAAATPALQTWSRLVAATAATAATASAAAAPAAVAATVGEPVEQATDNHAPGPTAQVSPPPSPPVPLMLQAWRTPGPLHWWAAGVAALAIVGGAALHLKGGKGPATARWVSFYEADGTTMAIDPDSIQRKGRQLTYRVSVVDRRENSSTVAVFTADCDKRQRRLETVQHYRGTRFDTATRYEVRGNASSAWPSSGADRQLMQAACNQP